jgi:predicted phosphodiesterase
MKFVHISDLHIGHPDVEDAVACLADSLCALPEDTRVIVITGDLVDDGTKEENFVKAVNFIQKLEGAGKEVFLVPGNHDYGTGVELDPYTANRFNWTFEQWIRKDYPGMYPIVSYIPEDKVWLIGLDSSRKELGFFTRFFAEGEIGGEQLDALDAALSKIQPKNTLRNETVVVYLHHNPFIDGYMARPDIGDTQFLSRWVKWKVRHWLRLKDASSFLDVVRDRIDVLLFGHQHNHLDYGSQARSYGIRLALDGSSTTGLNRYRRPWLTFRIIDTVTMAVTSKPYY